MNGARTFGVALNGLQGTIIDIEANVLNATPKFVLIGLPDAALTESRDRVRSALESAGAPLIARHVVVNLSPAALPKHGPGFDLAIALVAAVVSGSVSSSAISATAHIGELALDGRLRPVAGILPAVRAARQAGIARVVVPVGNLDEARLVPDIEVEGAVSLRQILIRYGAGIEPLDIEEPILPVQLPAPACPVEVPDLSDIVGQSDAREALVVAAAGGHHMLMLGPPGAGKTMLASRLPTILPPLSADEALEVAAIASLTGAITPNSLSRTPPWQAPHHTATSAALAGGGSSLIRPGAVVRAHRGVLFLDEAPEFPRRVLDVLRQPIESGTIHIQRALHSAEFPAAFQLVLAANPCPCGLWGVPGAVCECSSLTRRKYLGRISGPLLDRIDIQLWLPRLPALPIPTGQEESSADARARVEQARGRARRRLAGTPWERNADVSGSWLRAAAPELSRHAIAALTQAVRRGTLSHRGADRVLRLAWTLADLDAADVPTAAHIERALALRTGISR